jgi:hypothetical protein
MHVNIAARMLGENSDRPAFIVDLPRPHPKKQATRVQMAMDVRSTPVADQFGQTGSNQAPSTAR